MYSTALACVSLYGFILITQALQHQRVRPNGMAILPCGDLKTGKVTWSRNMKGHQVFILTSVNGEITRYMNNNSYNSLKDLSLIIWFVSSWDEGVYYCNGTAVACLSVKAAGENYSEDMTQCLKDAGIVSVMERVLMFGGVGLASLMFLIATAAAIKAFNTFKRAKLKLHITQTRPDYINLENNETDL